MGDHMENIHNIHKTGVVCVVTKEVATVNPLPFETQVDPANSWIFQKVQWMEVMDNLDNDLLRLWGLWNSLSWSLYQGEVLLEPFEIRQRDFRSLEKEWSRRTSYCWVSYNRSSSRYRFFTFCSTWTRTASVIRLLRDQASTRMTLIQQPSSKETMYGLKETHKAPVLGFWYVNVFAYSSGHVISIRQLQAFKRGHESLYEAYSLVHT